MIKKISVSYNDHKSSRELDIPQKCVHCGKDMIPDVLGAYSNENAFATYTTIGVFLRCVNEECLKFYALEYQGGQCVEYSYRPPVKIDLPENIEQVSETFVEIYSQATTAEVENLFQIAGVGYRKSLEFLIKDYAIRKHPDREDSIKRMMLGPVIGEYLSDFPKLQNLAKAATWIGNDETHYVRKHTDKDIQNMKAFIRAAAQFIAADYDADIAEEFTNT
ncbi:DUF4145 domain-containing protein [Enterococcus faecalis]|uniref:DUF4145 domain-containing protein n=1 Tax=Enterococcus faecalis TaxID=1351 RepID=UPI002DBD6FE2|nr:DUF4145 domain-containing protein [Enterococcus faecalis]MEB7497367.1 DUF4145 domain-containing protein [Enterococcus faecalis]